jgi:putative (di)nucleoside polyphosphate hydrolase
MAAVLLSSGILVLNAQAELLLCHATGTPRWDIPKGVADAGETELQAALRETAEETGLQFEEPERVLDLGRFAYLRGKDLHLHAVLIERIDASRCVCSTHFRDAQGRMRPEMDAYAWVAFGDLAKRCGKSLAALLTGRLSLPVVLRDLQALEREHGPMRWAWKAG